MGNESTAENKRLFSLDALRGLDMILLTIIAPLVNAAQRGWKCFPDSFMHQFNHYWGGFTLFDIIMPLFIFMCGAAIPLALEKRLAAGGGFWRHVLGRVALLWAAGGLVQGDWITLDPLSISPFSNTLQSIAVGYLVVAAVLYTRKNVLAIVVPVVCAVVYTVALAAYGDYSEFGNLAYKIDISILRAVLPTGNRWVENPNYYTWFLTSLMFVVMAFAGYHSTRILQRVEGGWRKAGALSLYGIVLLVVGAVSLVWIPCIKPIYTLSFTSLSMGVCVLMLAGLYVFNDILGCRKGWEPVLFFGRMALAAYFISHFFRPVLKATAELFGNGFCRYLPDSARPFVIQVFITVCLVVAMLFWRRIKVKR